MCAENEYYLCSLSGCIILFLHPLVILASILLIIPQKSVRNVSFALSPRVLNSSGYISRQYFVADFPFVVSLTSFLANPQCIVEHFPWLSRSAAVVIFKK